MKKTALFFAFALLAFAGCKNNLNVLAPYKDITVVYGLIDQNDSVQYIRVNKAFEGNGDAYTMAKQYDSISYPVGTITVQLQDYSNGNLINTITLDTTTAVPLDSGIFSYPHQVIYRTPPKTTLNANDTYKLVVTNEKTGKVITGSTQLLPDEIATQPNDFMSPSFPVPLVYSSIYAPTVVQFNSNSQALIYQLTYRFFYNEIDTLKKDTTYKYVDWVFPQQSPPSLENGYPIYFSYAGTAFIQFMKGSIPPATGAIKRVAINMEVIISSGSQDLYTYIELSQPSLGINQEKPFFSDVKNGIGIFTARHTQTIVKPINSVSIDSLVESHTVSDLNFKFN